MLVVKEIPEAQAFSGCSREFLHDAISQGKLEAQVLGKSWRIKRGNLKNYVTNFLGKPSLNLIIL